MMPRAPITRKCTGRNKVPMLLQQHLVVVVGIFFLLANVIGPSMALLAEDDYDGLSNRQLVTTSNLLSRNSPCHDAGQSLTSFASNVTIEFNVVCETLAPSDIALLQDGIMDTYNNLLQPDYCDPFSRLISNVTYVNEMNTTNDGSRLQVLFAIAGTCQGCDSIITSSSQVLFYTATEEEGVERPSSCPCPTDALASRAATEDEFLAVYESTLVRDSQELICVTSTTAAGDAVDVPTLQPSPVPTAVAVDCPVTLSTSLLSQFAVTLNENATQTSYEELGQDLMETYNSLMNATYTTCQTTKYRQITKITVNTDSTFVQRMLSDRQMQTIVEGGCDGCATELSSTNQMIFYNVEGGCDGCDDTKDDDDNAFFFDPNVLSQTDFVSYYATIVDTGLDFFSEIVTVTCPSNISRFENVVIVEYVPEFVDSNELVNDDRLKEQLADIFVTSYNDLAREYCDPYSRQLTSATIILVGENNTFGNIPVEMAVVGTCNNCDGLDLRVYDLPTSTSVAPNGTTNNTDVVFFEDSVARKLFESGSQSGGVIQGIDSSCYCPAHPIGNRGVYETEFLDAYRSNVHEASNRQLQQQIPDGSNEGVGLEVAECQFGTEFRTGFSFAFDQDIEPEDLTDEEKGLIVESLKQAIAELYTVNEMECNPDFRSVEVVELGPTRSQGRRRKVQQVVPTPAPAPAQLGSFQPSFSLVQGSPTVMQPVNSAANFFIYVAGLCNGCENQITFDDQTTDARRVQADKEEWLRLLLQYEAISNCFCPIGSEILAPPTRSQLLNRFDANLQSAGIPYSVLDFREIPVVDCTVPVSQFQSEFKYTILLESNATAMNVQAVGDVARWTYDDISQDYCDPFGQTINSIELIGFSPRSNGGNGGTTGCAEYDATFRLTGTCRGCTDASTLILESSPTSSVRQLSMNDQDGFPYPLLNFGNVTTLNVDEISKPWMKLSSKLGRGLQASLGNDCFCDGSIIASRPPSTDEYNKAFATALGAFQLTKVCGLPNFVPTAEPTVAAPIIPPSPAPQTSPNNNNKEKEPQDSPTAKPTERPTPKPVSVTTMAPTSSRAPRTSKAPTPKAPTRPIAPSSVASPSTPTRPDFPSAPSGPSFPSAPSAFFVRRRRRRRLRKVQYL